MTRIGEFVKLHEEGIGDGLFPWIGVELGEVRIVSIDQGELAVISIGMLKDRLTGMLWSDDLSKYSAQSELSPWNESSSCSTLWST